MPRRNDMTGKVDSVIREQRLQRRISASKEQQICSAPKIDFLDSVDASFTPQQLSAYTEDLFLKDKIPKKLYIASFLSEEQSRAPQEWNRIVKVGADLSTLISMYSLAYADYGINVQIPKPVIVPIDTPEQLNFAIQQSKNEIIAQETAATSRAATIGIIVVSAMQQNHNVH